FFLVLSFSKCFYKMMDFGSHFPGTSTKEFVRKPLFVIIKTHRNNRNLVINSQSESSVLEFVQNNRSIIRNSSFGKNTNTQTLVKTFLGLVKNFFSAFGISSIDQNTGTFIKKSEKRNFSQFLFPYKNKRIVFHYIKH